MQAFKGLSDAWPCVDFHDPVNSLVPPDEPLFVPRPPTVFFSDYEPPQVLSATLYMRNQDKVSLFFQYHRYYCEGHMLWNAVSKQYFLMRRVPEE